MSNLYYTGDNPGLLFETLDTFQKHIEKAFMVVVSNGAHGCYLRPINRDRDFHSDRQ